MIPSLLRKSVKIIVGTGVDPEDLCEEINAQKIFIFSFHISSCMPEGMENRCLICGKKLHDPLAIYCPECEYELKRVKLKGEESLEEWLERMREERGIKVERDNKQPPLERFFN